MELRLAVLWRIGVQRGVETRFQSGGRRLGQPVLGEESALLLLLLRAQHAAAVERVHHNLAGRRRLKRLGAWAGHVRRRYLGLNGRTVDGALGSVAIRG